jgi:hypothetical protein
MFISILIVIVFIVCFISFLYHTYTIRVNLILHFENSVTQASPTSLNRQLQVESQPASTFKVRAGEWDTQTMKERLPYQERMVSRIISHPQYSSKSLANDVVSFLKQKKSYGGLFII